MSWESQETDSNLLKKLPFQELTKGSNFNTEYSLYLPQEVIAMPDTKNIESHSHDKQLLHKNLFPVQGQLDENIYEMLLQFAFHHLPTYLRDPNELEVQEDRDHLLFC